MSYTLYEKSEYLMPGQVAFLVGYHDREFRFPFVVTYVFLGVLGDPENSRRQWVFQIASSYVKRPLKDVSEAAGEDFLILNREGLETMLDTSGLIEELTGQLKAQRD